jgi:CheY-like chemotaxis protein
MLLKKLVLAEDDDAIAHMVNMALGDAGYLCLRARDGVEAMNLVRLHAPDLLILDVMMPRVDGLEVARRIKDDVLLSRTPILMLTALSSVDNKVEGFESGADDYVVKPFNLREFAARVHALIRASRRERDRNPTTGLPGAGAIDERIGRALAAGEPAAVIHLCVCDFERFVEVTGFARADAWVAALGRSILTAVQRCGHGDFVGHLGGVDFIAVASSLDRAEELAREVLSAFREGRHTWLLEAEQQVEPQAAQQAREATACEALAMVAAVASTSGLGSGAIDALAGRLAGALRQGRQGGQDLVIWHPDTA